VQLCEKVIAVIYFQDGGSGGSLISSWILREENFKGKFDFGRRFQSPCKISNKSSNSD